MLKRLGQEKEEKQQKARTVKSKSREEERKTMLKTCLANTKSNQFASVKEKQAGASSIHKK